MKELSIEEKAKAYDESLKAAIIAHKDEDKHLKATLERIFLELKESEDDKMREMAIKAVYSPEAQSCIKSWGINPDDVIAWLEKKENFSKKDVDDAYLKGVTDTKNKVEKQYEASYQIRKDIATFIFNYRGDIKDRAKWMNYLGIKVSFVEKQGKQKSADIQSIEKRAHEVFPDDDDENTPLYRQAFIDGAVDYIDCGCKNSTWSEDDKGILLSIKCVIDNIWHSTSDIDTGGYSKEELKEMWEWLDKIWQRVEYHEEKLDKKDE